jgi:hypothetical protein
MYVHPQIVRHWLVVGATAFGGVSLAVLAGIGIMVARRPSAKQREERRRRRLATVGRIVDGSLIGAEPAEEATPRAIIYRYRIAGVTYECCQDVSAFGEMVENIRLDYPVQVRYNRENPADSIVVAETWNGLWGQLHKPESRSRQLSTAEIS